MPSKMLFTKPLTALLNANHTPQIHTLLLVTPAGKLLSHSSPLPAYLLRAQATLASSIWSTYGPLTTPTYDGGPSTIAATLPIKEGDENSTTDTSDQQRNAQSPADAKQSSDLASVMVQLDCGTVVIRQLRCSLLFVVIGPTTTGVAGLPPQSSSITTGGPRTGAGAGAGAGGGGGLGSTHPSSQALPSAGNLAHSIEHLSISPPRQSPPPPNAPSDAPGVVADGAGLLSIKRDHDGLLSAAPSEAGSVATSRGAGAASIRRMKKQAEELANWLDGELAGFTLASEGR